MTTVLVAGALANKAGNGGAAWTRLSWVLGFRQLGFDVHFIEELSPGLGVPEVAFFEAITKRFDLDASLLCADGTTAVGRSMSELAAIAAEAVLLVNISGHLTRPDLIDAVPNTVFLDLDPGWTQLWHADGTLPLRPHDHWYTVGTAIGTARCDLPVDRPWRPVLQPVLLDEWPTQEPAPVDRFTTVGAWRGFGTRIAGNTALGPKAHEFRSVLGLPERVPEAVFEVALDIHEGDADDRTALHDQCWRLVDPHHHAGDPWSFREYVQASPAEFSVAQGMYTRTGCGWFSDRTTRYLASGRPTLVQDTGFSATLPTGEGLLTFTTLDEAVDGARAILADPDRHAKAARTLAEEHFATDIVIGRLCEEVGVVS